MRRSRNESIELFEDGDEAASHRCILATLRILSKSQISTAGIPPIIADMLSTIVTKQEIDKLWPAKHKAASSAKTSRRQNRLPQVIPLNEGSADAANWSNDEVDRILQEFDGAAVAPRWQQSRELEREMDEKLVAQIKEASQDDLKKLLRYLVERFELACRSVSDDWIGVNAALLQTIFKLTDADRDVVALALSAANMRNQDDAVSSCVTEVFYGRAQRKQARLLMTYAVARPQNELTNLFDPESALRSSGIFDNVSLRTFDMDDVMGLSVLGQLFSSERFTNQHDIRNRLLRACNRAVDPNLVLSHLQTQRSDIKNLLDGAIRNAELGVNVLIYGPPGTGKTEFVNAISKDLGAVCFEVGSASGDGGLDASREDRLAFLKLANKLIQPEERAFILLDEAEDIFDRLESPAARSKGRRRGSKAWMNSLLEEMRIPTIWITNDIQIDPAHIRRFIYIAEFKTPPLGVRRQIVKAHTEDLLLAHPTIEKLARNAALTPAMLSAAARFVRIANDPLEPADETLLRHTRATQDALKLRENCTIAVGETQFDPEYTNLDADITVTQLCSALRRKPQAALLFSGPPGSGKTQLGRHLAESLEREVLYRTGSDLLDKYVGETEQRIADLFRSCDAEREIIFLDEAESLLGNRENMSRSWEISHVNEFLRQVEQFKGVFIAATNHPSSLDAALMRRFTFRLGFKPLNAQQRMKMFCQLADLADVAEVNSCLPALSRLDQLTAGDFANVKRRFAILDVMATAEMWLSELAREHSAKGAATSRSIGFA